MTAFNEDLIAAIANRIPKHIPTEIDGAGCSLVLGAETGPQVILTIEPDAEYLAVTLASALKAEMDTFR